MSVLTWDQTGEHLYETGVKKGVLYPFNNKIAAYDATKTYKVGDRVSKDGKIYVCKTEVKTPTAWSESNWYESSAYGPGVAWNGLTGITEKPSGADETALYADDQKYLSLRAAENYGATIEAYTYPDEFAVCDGSASLAPGVTIGQQKRKTFGLSYETIVGNDTENDDYGKKIHIMYGATASPSERSYKTVNESPEATTFSWEASTVPVDVSVGESSQFNKTSTVTIDTTKLTEKQQPALKKVLDALRGTETTEPYLPSPGQIYNWFNTSV